MLTSRITTAYNTALAISNDRQPSHITNSASNPSKFDSVLPTNDRNSKAHVRPYRANLTPFPSTLRPHCLAGDRLRLWRPSKSRADDGDIIISETDLERILEVINVLWAKGTRDVYGAGLLVFHIFCDLRKIPEDQRCPVSLLLIIAFILSCAGSYAGTTLANYVFAV